MKKIILIMLLITAGFVTILAQTRLKGRIVDPDGQTLPGANILIKGSYDGASADTAGYYSFFTTLKGKQFIMASFIGFAIQEKEISLDGSELTMDFTLEEQNEQIGDVVITAGMFETADQKKSVTLQPLDIVTTPSAAGDIYGALTSLPGATMVGEDGRLFVRGGDGYESKTFIDGLLVKKPYSSTTPDLPTRGRFSPFMFSGTMFSTGGYSAEYGQALSSALILTTNAFPERTQTDLSIMTVGLGATQTFKSENAAVSVGFEYYNLQPYFSIARQKIDWERYPQSLAGTLIGRYRLKGDGILKVFSNFKSGSSALLYPEMNEPGSMQKISLNDLNNYTNINYSGSIGGGWMLRTGLSFTYDEEKMSFRAFDVDEYNTNLQGKIVLKNKLSKRFTVLFGSEEVFNRYHEKYAENATEFSSNCAFDDFNSALFAEAEIKPLQKLAVRAGVRGEYSSVIDKPAIAVRASTAWAFTNKIQASFAYGSFYQTPEETLLRFTHSLYFEKAEHFIGNIQYEANDRILRIEAYYKKYSGLVVYDADEYYNPALYSNDGDGYSQGFDIFFRDRRSIKNMDYWVSYSFLDAERYYRFYPEKVTPSFVAKHSFNVVAKKYVSRLNTQFGAIFTWASGRPYNDPNSEEFMGELTRDYRDLSLNISYLTSISKKSTIVYTSLSNVLGRDNIYGYRYYETPNQMGEYESIPVRPEAKRFFMVGVFITL
ncbi:MAG: TonB-dependent receptor [Bacteroidales bacterium]|nr:TonB-dependent receptor [Bacteroidales bacterium]